MSVRKAFAWSSVLMFTVSAAAVRADDTASPAATVKRLHDARQDAETRAALATAVAPKAVDEDAQIEAALADIDDTKLVVLSKVTFDPS